MKTFQKLALAGSLATISFASQAVTASAQEAYVGELREVAFNFCPRGWLETKGQLLSISQNQTLFSLLGTQFGGDGRTTFALPNSSAPNSTPAPTQSGGEVRIYQHCGFEGWSQSVGLGNYGPGGFGSHASFADNDASSIRISGDWEVVLYDGPNQTGGSVTVSGDESCLVGKNFNDRLTSMTVRRKSASAPAQTSKTKTCIAVQGIYPPRN